MSAPFLMLYGIISLFAVFTGISLAAGSGTEWIETSVVADTYDQVYASISGSVVVWQDYRNKQLVPPNTGTGCSGAQNCTAADIYALDLNGGAERRLTTTFNGLDPDISGSLVAWRDWDTGRVVVHDLTDDSRIDASTAATQMVAPSISGNRVVWGDYRNSTEYGDIYMRDLTAPIDEAVVLGSDLPAGKVAPQKDKRSPDLDGDIVVWEDMRNAFQDTQGWWHNPDIYMKNLATGVEEAVCTNTSDQYNPVIAGNRVYWMDYRNNNWDVYMKDISTGVETRLTVNNSHQSWPSASGDFVAWKDTREGDEDIYMRNMANGVEQRVNTDPDATPTAGQKIPVVDGTRVVWMDKRAGNWDIYSARDEVAPQVASVAPAGLIAGDTTSITALYSDGGTGVDASTVAVTVDGMSVAGCTATATRVDCPAAAYPDGNHAVVVSVSDYSGNTSSSGSFSFDVDTTAPVISAVAPSGYQLVTSATVTASFSDLESGVNTSSVQVYLDGTTLVGCTVSATFVSCPVSGLSQGGHTISVSAAD
ncbi:MAG: Ig-like domain-containing protein, partial [Thermoleophilia bacterium]